MGGTATVAGQANANQQGLPFLPFSVARPQECDGSPQTYATGTDFIFTSKSGVEGMAEAIVFVLTLPVTPTIASGNKMVYSPMRSFFNEFKLSQGGQTYRDTHPYYYVLENAAMRYRRILNRVPSVGEEWATSQWATANLPPTSLPALTTGTAVTITYVMVIPLRKFRGSAAGMFPVGDATIPLRIELFSPTALAGSDPENNPFLITAGSSDTVAINSGSTIRCYLWYRTPLVYAASGSVAAPVVGTQWIHTRTQTPLTSVGSETYVAHRNLYPHDMIFHLIEDGNANANATTSPGNYLGMLGAGSISRYQFRLTSTDTVDDLDTAQKIQAWLYGWQMQWGLQLPDGLWPYVPILGEAGLGLYTDQDLQVLHQFPNFQVWQNTQTVFTVASGTSLNSSGTGLARITTLASYMSAVGW